MKLELSDAFDAVFAKKHGDADDGPARAVWHVELDGVEAGPLTLAELGRYVEAGRVDPSTLVWRDGFRDWRPAGEIPEIDALFAAPPIPAKRTQAALAALVEAELATPAVEPALDAPAPDAPAPAHIDLHLAPSIEALPLVPRTPPAAPDGLRPLAIVVAGLVVVAALGALAVVAIVLVRPAPTVIVVPRPRPPAPAPAAVAPVAPVAPMVAPAAPPPVPVAPAVVRPPVVRPPVVKPKPACDPELKLGCGAAHVDRDVLTQGDVLVGARKNLASVRACAEKHGSTEKLTRADFKIKPDGTVVDARVAVDGPLGACLVAAIGTWKFPTSNAATPVHSLPLPLQR